MKKLVTIAMHQKAKSFILETEQMILKKGQKLVENTKLDHTQAQMLMLHHKLDLRLKAPFQDTMFKDLTNPFLTTLPQDPKLVAPLLKFLG